jgi:ribonuclease VapC
MIFVDASAMIAMMAGEADGDAMADRLAEDRLRFVSAISIWESIAGLAHRFTFSVDGAREAVQSFRKLNDLEYVGIGEREYELAADAYAQFGKGRHPAALNMGDCFAYACAKANRAALLFKGDDFGKTDIRVALQRTG